MQKVVMLEPRERLQHYLWLAAGFNSALEVELQTHDDPPRIGGGSILPQRPIHLVERITRLFGQVKACRGVYACELRVVEGIVHLQPVLQPDSAFARQVEVLEQGDVPV